MIEKVLSPRTIAELMGIMSPELVLVAGATDVMPMYSAGLISGNMLVDLTRIPELEGVVHSPSEWVIGAAVTMAELAAVGDRSIAALSDAAAMVGSCQTRNRATLGGNICRASPAGDLLAPVLACEGRIHILSPAGARDLPAEEFFRGPGVTGLEPGEVVTRIAFPNGRSASAYARATTRSSMDLAIVGVAVAVRYGEPSGEEHQVESLRVAVSGAGPVPVLVPLEEVAELGTPLERFPGLAEVIGERAQEMISPIDDVRASAWYRRRMVSFLIHEVLARVMDRIDEGTGTRK